MEHSRGFAAMTDIFAADHFRDDTAARKLIEGIRWPDGPVCPYCGVVNHAYPIKKSGWFRCAEKACRKDFTVTIGTVMERSHIPLHKWMIGFYLMNSSKKGVSAHQLHRTLGIKYQSAWFMCHRIREAMRSGGLVPPIGGTGKVVEADETYFGSVESTGNRIRRDSDANASRRSADTRPSCRVCFSRLPDFLVPLRGRSFSGLGRVFTAPRNAASKRRCASSGLYFSLSRRSSAIDDTISRRPIIVAGLSAINYI
jgi:transposase-like protein